MIKVGITGGIGSGKSTVCELFRKFNTPVFDSDSVAKEQYMKLEVKRAVIKILGVDVIKGREIDNVKLANILFKDKGKLDEISKIVIPFVMNDFNAFCTKNEDAIYCVFESAIIFERNMAHLFDKIITVVADKDTRVKRVMSRNNLSYEEVAVRMNTQLSDDYKIDRSNYVINNNGEDLSNQINKIHSDIVLTYTEPYCS